MKKITRKQIRKSFNENKNEFATFEMSVYWMYTDNQNLCDNLDDPEMVEQGHLLQDISFEPLRLVGDEIVYKVIVGDLSEYFNEENY